MTTTATIETVSCTRAAGKHFFESVEKFSWKHSQFGGDVTTIEDMYGTNVLSAPRAAAADVMVAYPSFRIRHSRPSAGYEVPSHRAGIQAKPRLRLTTRGRVVLFALVAFPVAIALFAMSLNGGEAFATADARSDSFDYVTVLAGQSLWELALELDPSADPRDVIYDVLRLNQLTSAQIYPGQRLAVPAAYTGSR